ncbi:MAG: hypothetical protein N2037_06565 [Acidimicrobiales bacterium]|nr:hypothetical protein [Acidimicrobiales bacterium]
MTRLRAVAWAVVLSAWTAFVWITRLQNAAADSGLVGVTRTGTFVLAGTMLALAGVSLVDALVRRSTRLVQVLAVVTIGVWAIRVPQILAAAHELGFKVVHTVLGMISIGLALAALRWAARQGGRNRPTAVLEGSC